MRGDRGRVIESQADSMLIAEPDTGLSLETLRTRPEPESKVGHLTDGASQEPHPHPRFKQITRNLRVGKRGCTLLKLEVVPSWALNANK